MLDAAMQKLKSQQDTDPSVITLGSNKGITRPVIPLGHGTRSSFTSKDIVDCPMCVH